MPPAPPALSEAPSPPEEDAEELPPWAASAPGGSGCGVKLQLTATPPLSSAAITSQRILVSKLGTTLSTLAATAGSPAYATLTAEAAYATLTAGTDGRATQPAAAGIAIVGPAGATAGAGTAGAARASSCT